MKKTLKILSFLAIVLSLAFVFGCGNKKQSEAKEALDKDLALLEEACSEYADNTVTANIPLATTLENGSTVVWTSSNTAIMDNSGNIGTLPNGGLAADGELPKVTLTAEIAHEGTEEKATYSFTTYIDKVTADGLLLLQAKAALTSMYEGDLLSGFRVEGINDDGSVSGYSYVFSDREDCTCTYTSSERIIFDSESDTPNKATIIRPTEAECVEGKNYAIEGLKVKLVSNDVEINFIISLQISQPTPLMKVSELRDLMDTPEYIQKQDSYTFRGTVSLVWESNTTNKMQGFFVQDDRRAILIYSAGINDNCEQVEVGDEVLVTATTCFYEGLAETSSVSGVQVLVKAEDNTARYEALERIEVNAETFNNETLKGKDCILASAYGLIYDHMTDSNGNPLTEIGTTSAVLYFYYVNSRNKPISVPLSLDKYTTDYNDIKKEFNALKPGDIVNISECAISWYGTSVNLKIANKGKAVVDKEAELSTRNRGIIDNLHAKELTLKPAYAKGEYELPKTLTLGTSILWSTDENTDSHITIISKEVGEGDDVETVQCLKITDITDAIEFTLVMRFAAAGTTMEYKLDSMAINPLTLSDILANVDDGTFKQGSALIASVVDFVQGGTYAILNEGNRLAYLQLLADSEVEVGDEITILLSTAVKENGIYKLSTKTDIKHEMKYKSYAATLSTVADLSVTGLTKIELDSVTVASNSAKVSDTVTIEFVGNKEGTTKLADGTYHNLKGYAYNKNDSTITFLVIGETVKDYALTLTPQTLLGYESSTIAYGRGMADVEGIYLYYTELGAYGSGIQMRAVSKSSNDPKFGSMIQNLEPLYQGIKEIKFVYNSGKSTYDNTKVFVITFGNELDGTTYTTQLDLSAGVAEYTITPDAGTYTYVKIAHDDDYLYSMYWDEIEIVLNQPEA